jgi:hypothetical protein
MASMDSHNFAADRKTQAETVSFCGVERFEEALLVLGVNADAGIRDRYEDIIVCSLCAGGQDEAPSLDPRHGFDRIAYEIEDDVLKVNSVRLNFGQ